MIGGKMSGKSNFHVGTAKKEGKAINVLGRGEKIKF
jgi:hypothetical protein